MSVYRPEERRLVLRLMAYWDDLRNDRDFPSYAELDPATIGDDWSHCFTLRVTQPLTASPFYHLGEIYSSGLPSGSVATLGDCPQGTLLDASLHYLDRVLQKRVPISLGGHAHLGEDSILYRSILLPLSNDGHTIDSILGGANFRVVTTDEAATASQNE